MGWWRKEERGERGVGLGDGGLCGVGECGMCEWRGWVMWEGGLYEWVGKMVGEYGDGGWVLVRVRVGKCGIREVGERVRVMNGGLEGVKDGKEFGGVVGWVGRREVRGGKEGRGEGDLERVVMVWGWMLWGDGYVKDGGWVELWGECVGVEYEGKVEMRVVKWRKGKEGEWLGCCVVDEVGGVVVERVKYCRKGGEMVVDGEWLVELRGEVEKGGFVGRGGVVKEVLEVEGERKEDLIMGDGMGEGGDEGWGVGF